jgi:hypothetical protein
MQTPSPFSGELGLDRRHLKINQCLQTRKQCMQMEAEVGKLALSPQIAILARIT